MLSSQNSQLAIVPGNSRRNPPAGSDDVFEPLLESKEAAALLKMHPRALKRKARQGKIPGIQETWVKHIDPQAFRSKSKTPSTSQDRRHAISGLRSSAASPFDELQLQDYIKSTG